MGPLEPVPALELEAPRRPLRGPLFNIQEKITVHFHTQYMHCTRIRVSKTFGNENSNIK